MNKSAFLELIQHVSDITDQQTDELEKVASAFPYCQTAHLLLAKSAYDKGSMLSSQRLRRASSYATDRQLLKKIIHAVPAPPGPLYSEAEKPDVQVPEQLPVKVVQEEDEASPAEAMETAATDNLIINSASGTDNEPETNRKAEEQDAAPQAGEDLTVNPAASEAEDKSEDSLYSELAMLLTINSLSSSSTDLFVAKPDKTAVAPAPIPVELLPSADPAPETTSDKDAGSEQTEEPSETLTPPVEADTPENPETASAILPVPEQTTDEDKETDKPFGEINYSSDEIDRLYAEDALGYWMGSSRMGEVLQLKDEYTRLKPRSFHPELILEYSKTHELEKAIQPSSNVLSHQLNIIDQFLKLNPRLKTMANMKFKSEPQEDLSLKSTRIKKGMASENLASIFIKQGKVKKAIKIYEQLILKNPEKKTYFAEQIEKLQTLN